MTDPIIDRLDQIKGRADKATEGPWGWSAAAHGNPAGGPTHHAVKASGGVVAETDYDIHGALDAEFIAHARTDVQRMEAALRAVLDEHRRAEQYQRLAGSPRASEWEHYCPADQKTCPCPTYQAIADALGVEIEGGDR